VYTNLVVVGIHSYLYLCGASCAHLAVQLAELLEPLLYQGLQLLNHGSGPAHQLEVDCALADRLCLTQVNLLLALHHQEGSLKLLELVGVLLHELLGFRIESLDFWLSLLPAIPSGQRRLTEFARG
jgi:hypothetical protein